MYSANFRKSFAERMRVSQTYASASSAVKTHKVKVYPKEWKNVIHIYHNNNVFREIPSNPKRQKYLDIKQLNNWYKYNELVKEIENQIYDKKRIAELGPDLAALHFFTYREAAVQIKNHSDWIMGTLSRLADKLPHTFTAGVHVEAIDCANFKHGGIRYEGLLYLAGLKHLQWLSLRNQRYVDVWCLDRIAGLVGGNLQFLDISSCDLNVGCVGALCKLRALQVLVIKYPYHDYNARVALCNLEAASPNLIIKAKIPVIFEKDRDLDE